MLPCAGAVRGEENRDLEIPFHGSSDIAAASRLDGMFEISYSVRNLPSGDRSMAISGALNIVTAIFGAGSGTGLDREPVAGPVAE